MLLYIASAVSSPFDSSKRFTFHPLADLFISAAIRCKDYSLTFPPLSRNSITQLSETGRRGENENAQTIKMEAKRIRTRALSIASLSFYR